MRLYSGAQAKRVWEVRESSLGATSHVPGEPLNWEGWEDAAVAPEKLGGYLRDLRKMMADFGYKGSLYGHFGHACVHTRLNFDLQSKEGIAKFRKLRRRSRRPRRQLRRIALRRARRRTSPRRTPSQNVRPRTDAGLPQIQVRLGSRLEDESRQADRAQQARRKSSPRPELRSWEPQTHFQFPQITAASRTPPCAASESASAAAKKAASCVPAGASRTKKNTPPAAALTCSGR